MLFVDKQLMFNRCLSFTSGFSFLRWKDFLTLPDDLGIHAVVSSLDDEGNSGSGKIFGKYFKLTIYAVVTWHHAIRN